MSGSISYLYINSCSWKANSISTSGASSFGSALCCIPSELLLIFYDMLMGIVYNAIMDVSNTTFANNDIFNEAGTATVAIQGYYHYVNLTGVDFITNSALTASALSISTGSVEEVTLSHVTFVENQSFTTGTLDISSEIDNLHMYIITVSGNAGIKGSTVSFTVRNSLVDGLYLYNNTASPNQPIFNFHSINTTVREHIFYNRSDIVQIQNSVIYGTNNSATAVYISSDQTTIYNTLFSDNLDGRTAGQILHLLSQFFEFFMSDVHDTKRYQTVHSRTTMPDTHRVSAMVPRSTTAQSICPYQIVVS